MTDCCNDPSELPSSCSTFMELLRYRALQQSAQLAFTFLDDGETESATLTYRELDQYSRAIAAQLQSLEMAGERALLLYSPGLDYVAAFCGCLYAGVVAVPAYPPRNQRNTPRILAMATDAQAAIALTTTALLSKIRSLLSTETDSDALQWLTTDNLAAGIEDTWQVPAIEPNTLAFLQYTSGSTDTPKGVMVSHGNLLHNAAATYQLMEHSSASTFVSWLPAYHDMGLIGGILQPLYGGFPCILMPPAAFLQRPYRWLKAVSHYRGTTSGGPNFAYELCTHKVTPEQRQTLDLNSWSVAFNGAEPVRQETLERFSATFAPCGFRQEAFYPCYGMAEATLMVTGGRKADHPIVKAIYKSDLERNQAVDADADKTDRQLLVSCGRALPEQQVVTVHPDLTRCLPGEVGEIWVSGPSVGHGYWQRPEETAQAFGAYLSDPDEGPFLRTGDLGFLHNGDLFITGRAKDLIIIRGRNLYPHDIELAVERSHPELRAGSGAAFSVEIANQERLVVVQEVEFRQQPDIEEVAGAVRQAVAEAHEVQVFTLVLIKPGSILKTSSGKIQRRACRAAFLAGTLSVLGSSVLDIADEVSNQPPLNRQVLLAAAAEQRQSLLIAYLQQQVAQVLKVIPSQINCDRPLSTFGLDSLLVFDLKNRVESNLDIVIPVADFFQSASIAQLTVQILKQLVNTVSSGPRLQSIPRHQPLPLGLAQERLWFLNQLEPGNPFYNVAIAVRFTGQLNTSILEQSLNEVIRRHEALRTSFPEVDGQPMQVIHPTLQVTLPIIDLTGIQNPSWAESTPTVPAKIQSYILEQVQQPFDLSQVPLLRAKLLRLQQAEHLLLLTSHHIISDGWSVGVLIQELATLYETFFSQKPSPLPELSIQYADFANWQRNCLQGEVLKTQLSYWKQQLSGILPVLQLPTDRPRPAIQTFQGAKQPLAFPKALVEALKVLNQQEGVTLFMSLLAVFKTLLYCYTNQEDILVGSPVAGRTRAETKGLIGFFINTLILRTDLSGNPSFRELLKRLRKVALDGYAHQDLPFEKLVEALQPQRNLSYNPLFQAMFILQNTPIPSAMSLPELTLSPLEVDSGTSKFDLKLSLWESSEGLSGSLEYKTDLFDAITIARMANQFERLLCQVVTHPDTKLNTLATFLAKADNQQQHLQERQLEAASLQKLKLTRRKAIRAL